MICSRTLYKRSLLLCMRWILTGPSSPHSLLDLLLMFCMSALMLASVSVHRALHISTSSLIVVLLKHISPYFLPTQLA
jgi:hypothetical protein